MCVRSLTGRFSVIPCSLLSKVDELRAVSEATKPDIICIVENWLDKHIPNDRLFRLDRNRHRGDITIYVSILFFHVYSVLLQGGPYG